MGNNEIISVWVCRNVIFSTERYQVPKMTISTHRREEIVWFNLLCPSQLHNVIAVALRVRTCHWRDQADHRPRVFSRRQKTKKPRDSWRWPVWHWQWCNFHFDAALVHGKVVRCFVRLWSSWICSLGHASLPLRFGRRQPRILLVGALFCTSFCLLPDEHVQSYCNDSDWFRITK